MDEGFNFQGCAPADSFDFFGAHLPGQYSAGIAEWFQQLHAAQVVQAHLGRGVDRHIRCRLRDEPGQPQILHDERIYPRFTGGADRFHSGGKLPVEHQGIDRQMDGSTV